MKRYVAIVEEIYWEKSECRVRIPSKDGLAALATTDIGFAVLNQLMTKTDQLQTAKIPFHLRGLRVNDIILVLDSEDANDDYTVVGFFGSTYEE